MTIEESIHVAFDETNLLSLRKEIIDDLVDVLENTYIHEKELETKEQKKFLESAMSVKIPLPL